LLAPESWPGVGAVTMAKLVDLRYPNLWKRKKSDYSYKLENQLYGWETTKRTKPILVHTLSEGIKEYKFKIRSRGLISEMKSFVYNGEAMEPQEGCYSDRVIGFGIAWYLANMFVQDLDPENKTFRDIYMAGNHSGTMFQPNFKNIDGVRSN
jgi:hypothetical protein